MTKSLLLDKYYQPVDIITWQKAITLIVQDKAEVVEAGESSVRSVSKEFFIPRILRLVSAHYSKIRASFSKKSVLLRDRGMCAYCGQHYPFKVLTIDHIIPRVQGGKHEWNNVISACFRCNSKKGGKTPEQANMKLLFLPKIPTRTDLLLNTIQESDLPQSWKDILFAQNMKRKVNEKT